MEIKGYVVKGWNGEWYDNSKEWLVKKNNAVLLFENKEHADNLCLKLNNENAVIKTEADACGGYVSNALKLVPNAIDKEFNNEYYGNNYGKFEYDVVDFIINLVTENIN